MTIDFYYVPGSAPCRAVQLAASALGVDLNLKLTDLMKGEHLTPEFIKINPQHTVPTLVDNGFVVTESRAIIAYLADQYGKDDSIYPKDPKKRAIVNQRCYFDLSTLYQRFADLYYPVIFAKGAYDDEKAKKLGEALEFFNVFLSNSTYAAGDSITIADCTLAATVSTIDAVGFDISKYPNVVRWFQKCKSTLPAYATSNQAGVEAFKQLVEAMKAK